MRFKPVLLLILFCFLSVCYLAQAQKKNQAAGGGTGNADTTKKNNGDSLRAARAKVTEEYQDSAKKYRDSANEAEKRLLEVTREARKRYADSAKTAREHILDSTKTARAHMLDSTKAARQRALQIVQAARKHVADSLNAIHRYRSSKHYRDSVASARKLKLDRLKASRKATFDSLRAARQKITDSIVAVRKASAAKLKAIQKRRADSLAVIRKYRESRRYRDSVAVYRQQRMDSIRTARKLINDSLFAVRKHIIDSANIARKLSLDSANLARKLVMDSIKAVRKQRADSIAKVREAKNKLLKKKLEDKTKQQQLALQLKINQKRQAWSNQKMLKKKWSVPRQVVQNTFTRYNYYFNASKKMDEALANMQRIRRDNYDSVIGLYPFDPDRDSSVLAADMDSIIQKASIGIQIHDPRSKWDDDLYLLLGEAYYYKGGYDNAATAFHYIITTDQQKKKKTTGRYPTYTSHKTAKSQPSVVESDKKTMIDFLKHKPVHNEALLWLSRTYTQARQPEKAEAVLGLFEGDPNVPKNLQGRIALERAFINLKEGNDNDAAKQLIVASDDNNIPDWLRQRAAFLSGQLQQQAGDYTASEVSFKQVLNLYPKIDMDFYARKYLAYSSMHVGGDNREAIAALKKVLNDGKYISYYDQIYFILGRLAISSNDADEAISYLQKSTSVPRATRKQKAISFSALGTVYYSQGNYMEAKRSYDSSAMLAMAAPNDSMVKVAVHRSMVLDNVVKPSMIIHNQDSLLLLASLSDKEQRSAVRRYIRSLEKKREDSIYNAQNAGINSVAQADQNINGNNDQGNSYTSWYFSNATLMQQGYNDFKSKWGDRPLVDNWRRIAAVNKAIGSENTAGNDNSSAKSNKSANVDENGLPTEESLLALIPRTPGQKEKANVLIQKAYIDLANSYVRDLEDYPRALSTLDTFEKRYPANGQMDKVLYLRYIVALRGRQLEKAQQYSQKITDQFPNSEYAKLVRPKEGGEGLDSNNSEASIAAYYDQTYALLLQHQDSEVVIRVKNAGKQYENSHYKNRFTVVEAIALANTGQYGKADTILTEFIRLNPSDSLRPWADAVMQYIIKNKPVVSIGNKTVTSGNNSTNVAAQAERKPASYTYNAQAVHYCVIMLPGMDQRASGVKAAIGDFNTFKFSSLKLISNIDLLTSNQVLVVVKQFQNAVQAKIYLNTLKTMPQIFREYKLNEYHVFSISADNYVKLFTDRSVQTYLNFYKENYK